MSQQKSFTDLNRERREAELRDKIEVLGNIITVKLDNGELQITHYGDHAEVTANFRQGSAAVLHQAANVVVFWRYGIDQDNRPVFF